jgi:hypothetical protein
MQQAHAEFVRQSYKLAYLRGWHYATRDLWEEAKPRPVPVLSRTTTRQEGSCAAVLVPIRPSSRRRVP